MCCNSYNNANGNWKEVLKNIFQPHTALQRLDNKNDINSKQIADDILKDEPKKTNIWVYVGALVGVVTVTGVLIYAFKK